MIGPSVCERVVSAACLRAATSPFKWRDAEWLRFGQASTAFGREASLGVVGVQDNLFAVASRREMSLGFPVMTGRFAERSACSAMVPGNKVLILLRPLVPSSIRLHGVAVQVVFGFFPSHSVPGSDQPLSRIEAEHAKTRNPPYGEFLSNQELERRNTGE
jgi:hypothetical protein